MRLPRTTFPVGCLMWLVLPAIVTADRGGDDSNASTASPRIRWNVAASSGRPQESLLRRIGGSWKSLRCHPLPSGCAGRLPDFPRTIVIQHASRPPACGAHGEFPDQPLSVLRWLCRHRRGPHDETQTLAGFHPLDAHALSSDALRAAGSDHRLPKAFRSDGPATRLSGDSAGLSSDSAAEAFSAGTLVGTETLPEADGFAGSRDPQAWLVPTRRELLPSGLQSPAARAALSE